jgi:hypothetical protein
MLGATDEGKPVSGWVTSLVLEVCAGNLLACATVANNPNVSAARPRNISRGHPLKWISLFPVICSLLYGVENELRFQNEDLYKCV